MKYFLMEIMNCLKTYFNNSKQQNGYHPLEVECSTITDFLISIANTKNSEYGTIKSKILICMASIFPPESILTVHGKILLKNFLNI
jgi:anthranilate/para-aminobenzoate synthase component II